MAASRPEGKSTALSSEAEMFGPGSGVILSRESLKPFFEPGDAIAVSFFCLELDLDPSPESDVYPDSNALVLLSTLALIPADRRAIGSLIDADMPLPDSDADIDPVSDPGPLALWIPY